MPFSSIDIRCIEDDYMSKETDKRRLAPADTSPEIDVELLSTHESAPTVVPGSSGTTFLASSSQDLSLSFSGEPIGITHAMDLNIGCLA